MSLQFNVSQLLKSDVGVTRTYDFHADESMTLDGFEAEDVGGHVKFTLTNFGILASGKVAAALRLTCSRCLEPFELPVEISFDEEYQPLIDIETGLPSTAPRSDTAFGISSRHIIDLSEAIRQHLLLAVDLIPVCRSDCRGLCPTCGVNLNTGTCSCPPVEESGAFAVLQTLLKESEAESNQKPNRS